MSTSLGISNQEPHKSPDLVQPFAGADLPEAALKWGTALWIRVANYMPLTTGLNPTALLGEIGRYYDVMRQTIEAHAGTIVKFDGDSLLGMFWSGETASGHAERAVSAAVALMERLTQLNRNRIARGETPFRIGIGVNTGHMLVGQLPGGAGDANTVLGAGVDAARKLGSLNTQTPFHSIFLSESTLNESGSIGKYHVDDLGQVHLAGTATPLTVYAIVEPLPV